MSVLRVIEHRLESLFEGLFGRAFRSHVQPVEMARKLAKEMDDNKASSVSRTYAPNEYVLYLSPADRDQFRDYERALMQELSAYLAEHARRQGYALLTMPRVVLEEDRDLALGQFGIATRMVQPGRPRSEPAHDERMSPVAEPSGPAIPEPPPRQIADPPAAAEIPEIAEPSIARAAHAPESPTSLRVTSTAAQRSWLELHGSRHTLSESTVVLGRSRDCTIVIDDPGVSRRHCEIRFDGDVHVLVDVGSTNGVLLNGRRVARAALENGDRITLGQTDVRFVSVDE